MPGFLEPMHLSVFGVSDSAYKSCQRGIGTQFRCSGRRVCFTLLGSAVRSVYRSGGATLWFPMEKNVIYSLVVLSLLSGCRCTPSETERAIAPAVAHYSGWRALSRGVFKGDLVQIRADARDLTAGREVQTDVQRGVEALDRVSASLGFLQTASRLDELGAGFGRAALGCGACHDALGVIAPLERPEWSHETAVDWVVFGLVWGDLQSFPEPASAREQGLKHAFENPVVISPDTGKLTAPGELERLEALLGACWACHPPPLR